MKQLCAYCRRASANCPIYPPESSDNVCAEFASIPGEPRDKAVLLLASEVLAMRETEAHRRWRLMVEILEGGR